MNSEQAGIRASDADRERALDELRRHLVDGRLTLDEFQDRLDEAFAARTIGDVQFVLRELPQARAARTRPAPPRVMPPERRHGFRPPFAAIAGILALLWILGSPGFFFPFLPLLIAFWAFRTWSAPRWPPVHAHAGRHLPHGRGRRF